MDAICVLFLLFSPLRLSFASVVFDFNASLNDVAPVSPILLSVDLMRMEKEWIVDGCHLCVVSFCVLPPRSSFASVVFDFNASLNDVAPVFPMSLSVDLMRMKEWIVDGYHFCVVSFVFTTQIEFSECCV